MNSRAREVGWHQHQSKETPGETVVHPAVVLREPPGGGYVLMRATTSPRDVRGKPVAESDLPAAPNENVFWVDPATSDGMALGLTARTYFHRGDMDFVRTLRGFALVGQCPVALFVRLLNIANIRP